MEISLDAIFAPLHAAVLLGILEARTGAMCTQIAHATPASVMIAYNVTLRVLRRRLGVALRAAFSCVATYAVCPTSDGGLQHTVAILVNGDLLRFRSAFVHDAAAAIVQHMTSIVAASLDTNTPLPTTTMHYRALPALQPFFAQLPASATMPHAVRSFMCAFVVKHMPHYALHAVGDRTLVFGLVKVESLY